MKNTSCNDDTFRYFIKEYETGRYLKLIKIDTQTYLKTQALMISNQLRPTGKKEKKLILELETHLQIQHPPQNTMDNTTNDIDSDSISDKSSISYCPTDPSYLGMEDSTGKRIDLETGFIGNISDQSDISNVAMKDGTGLLTFETKVSKSNDKFLKDKLVDYLKSNKRSSFEEIYSPVQRKKVRFCDEIYD